MDNLVDSRHWRLARSYIGLFNTPLRTLDALHLANASLEEFELITSDQQLVHKPNGNLNILREDTNKNLSGWLLDKNYPENRFAKGRV